MDAEKRSRRHFHKKYNEWQNGAESAGLDCVCWDRMKKKEKKKKKKESCPGAEAAAGRVINQWKRELRSAEWKCSHTVDPLCSLRSLSSCTTSQKRNSGPNSGLLLQLYSTIPSPVIQSYASGYITDFTRATRCPPRRQKYCPAKRTITAS